MRSKEADEGVMRVARESFMRLTKIRGLKSYVSTIRQEAKKLRKRLIMRMAKMNPPPRWQSSVSMSS